MEQSGSGDAPLVSNRVNEKRELQNLNQRFAAYVQAVRSAHDKESRSIHHETNVWNSQSNERLKLYEQQISELQHRLDDVMREKQNLDLDKVKYETFASECENRIVSLNETVFEQQTELQRIHGALAAKDVELQEIRAEAMQPKLALDGARMELEDYKKRLEEAERRLHLEENLKAELQQLLGDGEKRMQQEVMLYQQELTEMRNKLEKSHHTILQLESKVHKVGQTDSNLAEMMRKVREASEAELRRFMQETDAKYNLNLQEVKMRMEADVHNLTVLAEENGHLHTQLDSQARDIRALEANLMAAENEKNVVATNLENEKTTFASQVRNLEKKLQETQDLLLIKIHELSSSQEANIPLRLEINAYKAIMEQEEKRLNLHKISPENHFFQASSEHKTAETSNQQLTPSSAFIESLSNGTKSHESTAFVTSTPYLIRPSQKHTYTSSKSYISGSKSPLSSYPLPNEIMPKRPASVPITTHGFRRVGHQHESSNWQMTDSLNKDIPRRSTSDADQLRSFSPSSESLCSQTLDIKDDKNDKDESIDELPPRPENPTPTKLPHRPSSINNARYIPASHGRGKDYFDAMFNDLRKDTLYTKVTEKDTGHGVARVTSIDQDYVNSTGSYATPTVPEPRTWYTGGATSATGNLNIIQVAEDGSYVRLGNTSATQEESIGGFMLQQNVGGHPVAMFRFPPRARLKAASSTTVWSARAVNGIHDPPCHYIWKQLDKWGTGPECTTILCRPNGQAVAWITSAPRKVTVSKGYNYAPNVEEQTKETQRMMEDMRVKKQQDERNDDMDDNDENLARESNADLQDSTSLPNLYTTKPTLYRDEPYSPRPNPILKRPKSSPSPITTKACGTSGLLPSRTGTSTTIQKLQTSTPQNRDFIQRLSNTDNEIIALTTQKSVRSKYGFDFMTHPPKVTNYDGTVR